MGIIPTLQSRNPGPMLEGTTPSRPELRSNTTGPLLQGVTSEIDRTQTTPAGEEWSMVQLALDEDPEALSILFARDKEKLYYMAFSVLGNKEDAEDALQDGLLSAYLNLRSFKGRSRFSTWVISIVINAARMKRRKLRSPPQTSLDDIVVKGVQCAAEWVIDKRLNPERVCGLVEAKELVQAEINRLPPLLRAAIRSHPVKFPSRVEATQEATVNRNTVKSRSSRARRQLATLLAARGVNSWSEHF